MSWVLLVVLWNWSAGGPTTVGTFYTLEACEAAKVAVLEATVSYTKRFAHCIAVQGLRSAK